MRMDYQETNTSTAKAGVMKYTDPAKAEDISTPQLTVADFENHTYLDCTPDTPLHQKMATFSQKFPLTINNLEDLPMESTLKMLSECFTKKGFITPYFPTYPPAGMTRIRLIWTQLQPYSFGLVDASGKLVGVATSADAADFKVVRESAAPTPGPEKHPLVAQLHEYYDSFHLRVKDRIPDVDKIGPGVLLDMYMLGIPLNVLTPSENLYVMYRLVEETHRRAVDHGFQYCLSENTHLYTQTLAKFFECERLVTDHPHDYVNSKGEKPFFVVPEKIALTIDLKTYTGGGTE